MSISFNFVPNNARASIVAIENVPAPSGAGGLFIPQKVAVVGQYDPAKTAVTDYVPVKAESVDQIGNTFGFGSHLHLMVRKLESALLKGVEIWCFPVPEAAGVNAVGTVTFTGTATSAGTLFIYIAGQKIEVSVAVGDDGDAIATAFAAAATAILDLPTTVVVDGVTTNECDVTAKFKGTLGNDITIRQNLGGTTEENAAPAGITVAIVAMATGATDPDPTNAFEQFGDVWYTQVVYPWIDDTNIDIMESYGAARFDPMIKRFFTGFVGSQKNVADFTTFLSTRNSQYTTAVPVDNCPNLPMEIAAAAVNQVTIQNLSLLGAPYKALKLDGILKGYDSDPWTWVQKDAIVKLGGSYTVIDAQGDVRIGDLVTTRTTNDVGAPDETYQWTLTLVVLQAIVYSQEVTYNSDPFVRGIVVDNDAITSRSDAVRPNTVKAYLIQLIDDLWEPQAWIKNRDDIVESIEAEINSGNPSRIDVSFNLILSTGLRIIAVQNRFSFSPV